MAVNSAKIDASNPASIFWERSAIFPLSTGPRLWPAANPIVIIPMVFGQVSLGNERLTYTDTAATAARKPIPNRLADR